jgi:O-antigen/teichoic acid export membrane protein
MPTFGKFTGFFFHTLGTSGMIVMLSFAISIITARYLGPDGRGKLALLILIPIFAVTFGRLGIGHSINYYASKAPKDRLISTCLVLSIMVSLIFSIVSIPFIFLVRDLFFKGIETTLIFLACSLIPFAFLYDYLPSIFQGFYKIKHRNLLVAAMPFFNLALLVVLVTVLKMGLWGAVIAYAGANGIVAIISLSLVFKELEIKKIQPDFHLMRGLLTYGFQSHIGLIFKELNYRGDMLLVSYFLNPAAVGYYAIAVNIAELLWKLPEAAGTVLLPKISSMDKKETNVFTPLVFRTIMFPMMAMCLAVLFLGKYIILMAFGQEFLLSFPVLALLLPGTLAMAFWKIIANTLIGLGHAIQYSITSGVALIVMILFDVILIPKMGLNGAAIASSISYLAATVFIIFLYVRLTGVSYKDILIPRKSDFLIYKKWLSQMIYKPHSGDAESKDTNKG